jgi:arginine decarboxylase
MLPNQLCLSAAGEQAGASSPAAAQTGSAYSEPCMALSPRDAFFAAVETVSADDAVGRIAAELLCPYPPGVPAVFPGEELTPQVRLCANCALLLSGLRPAGSFLL